MHGRYWQQRWEENRIGFHQQDINPYLIRYLPELGLRSDAHIFVPLCGKSLDLLWLRKQGFRVTGIELSQIAVEAFFAENHLQPRISEDSRFKIYEVDNLRIICGDFFELNKQDVRSIDAIYDRAALIAMNDDLRKKYAVQITNLFTEHQRMLLLTIFFSGKEESGPPFSVDSNAVHQLYASRWKIRELSENMRCQSASNEDKPERCDQIYTLQRF